MLDDKRYIDSERLILIFLFFIFIFLIYSNTLNSPWHLDDHLNIVLNERLHLRELNKESIIRTFFANPVPGGNKLYRPVSCLSLALNWYHGGDKVTGYHLINIFIHFLTACILFLTILNLLKTPNINKISGKDAYLIAALGALIWAINPLQTQAVTYIVQRMASLAAMFYISGIYFYVRGRFLSGSVRIYYLLGCVLSFMLAIGSKENAIMFPMALLLVEIIFFRNLDKPGNWRRLIIPLTGFGLSIILVSVVFFLNGKPLSFLNGYADRPFSLTQRLLTEPRIVLFYLSQFFYPAIHRLSIIHEVHLSVSLLKPWTTIPSIVTVFAIVGAGIFYIKKKPVFSFAILFFFLNHIVESSILPLEIIFEHRNYLPSLFLFFPLALGLQGLLNTFGDKKKTGVYLLIIAAITILLILLGNGTYRRNAVWQSNKALVEDVMNKAPNSPRALHGMALYYQSRGGF